MQYEFLTTNDNTKLAYQTSLYTTPTPQQYPSDSSDPSQTAFDDARTSPLASTCILLLHGFSGSSEYFKLNYSHLSARSWVVAPDLRGHGASQHSRGGYHVARLAADLHSIIHHLRHIRRDVRIYPVGCSIGAAVLWTYLEIFGTTDEIIHGMIFVDQAPLQDRSAFGQWDRSKAHCSLYDEKTLLDAQAAWSSDDPDVRKGAHRGLVSSCLGYRVFPADAQVSDQQAASDEEFFTRISARCDGVWLAKLMADHTRYDHREAIEGINVPVLVMAGRQSGCFPLEGMLESVRRVNANKERPLAKGSVFECGHWLFYEEPKRFNSEVIDFVQASEAAKGIK